MRKNKVVINKALKEILRGYWGSWEKIDELKKIERRQARREKRAKAKEEERKNREVLRELMELGVKRRKLIWKAAHLEDEVDALKRQLAEIQERIAELEWQRSEVLKRVSEMDAKFASELEKHDITLEIIKETTDKTSRGYRSPCIIGAMMQRAETLEDKMRAAMEIHEIEENVRKIRRMPRELIDAIYEACLITHDELLAVNSMRGDPD